MESPWCRGICVLGKPVVSGNMRFGEDARRSAFDKAEHDKGQGLSNEGVGLYETGSLGLPSHATPYYDDYQFQGADPEQRSVQELEGYFVQKSEDTTKSLQNCLKVAEDIKGDAPQTLVNLNQTLRRTHGVAYDIDQSITAVTTKGHHLEQRTALGLDAKRHADRRPHSVPDSQSQTTQAKLEVEKTKQDDARGQST